MATVILTDSVKNEIVRKLDETFEPRIKALDVRPPELSVDTIVAQYLERTGTKEMFDHARQFGWFSDAHYITCFVPSPDGVVRGDRIQLAVAGHWPEGWTHYGKSGVSITDDEEMSRTYVQWEADKAAVREERKAARESVRALLNRHKTLKTAIQEWSPLEKLLSNNLRERYFRKVERPKPAATVREADPSLDNVAGSLVANLFAAGG